MSTFHGNISGTGHHIGDGGTVRNTVAADLAALLDLIAQQITAAGPLREDVLTARAEVRSGRIDTSRIRRLATTVRDSATGAGAVVVLAEQVLRLIG
ncbi:hypothetical protein [Actinoplanes sp. HUAS TT8]|uniref:hypothetical protein n=1 Tax=Actinoplanes sp. HUAS TT8 TaxID=3447453 RepID=UPI003F51D703